MLNLIKFFQNLLNILCRQKSGTIIVSQGCPSKIFIITGFHPKKVWIEMSEVCGIPVCHAELDSFDYKILPNGFLIHVILHSKERKITWIAKK
jgi:hypothetical protein